MFACTRKERQISRAGTPYLTVELRDRTRHDRRRARSATPTCSPGASSAASWCACAAASSASASELQIDARRDRAGATARTPTRPASCRPPTATSMSSKASSSTSRARSTTRAERLLARLLGDRQLRSELAARPARCRRSVGARAAGAAASAIHHAYLGGLLEHTVAVATLALELCTLHPRLDRDLLLCAAIVHDLGKTREFTYGAEIERSDEGRLLGHVELGPAPARRARAAGRSTRERRLALEHCVILHHGPDAAAGSASPRRRRSRCIG